MSAATRGCVETNASVMSNTVRSVADPARVARYGPSGSASATSSTMPPSTRDPVTPAARSTIPETGSPTTPACGSYSAVVHEIPRSP